MSTPVTPDSRPVHYALGVDLGGTKCAAGLFDLQQQKVITHHIIPTRAATGGHAVLEDMVGLIQRLRSQLPAETLLPLGIGVPELVTPEGAIVSAATIPWHGWPIAEQLAQRTGLVTVVEADVRAAALAEARCGAGSDHRVVLYVTVGTGISASLVLEGKPYVGTLGLTGTFASARHVGLDEQGQLAWLVPLEQIASGPGLIARWGRQNGVAPPCQTTAELLRLSDAGDIDAALVVDQAALALGASMAQLVNLLDPGIVILGGGLGLVRGRFRARIDAAFRQLVWSPLHQHLPLVDAHWGPDAGWIGAALAGYEHYQNCPSRPID